MRTIVRAMPLLACVMTIPTAGFAQDVVAAPPPWQPPPTLVAAPPPMGSPMVAGLGPSVRYDAAPGSRYALEALAGLGTGIVPAALVGIIGTVVWSAGRSSSSDDFPVGVFATAEVIAILGQPLGVTLVGNARGGNGGYGWSLLGTLGGDLVGNLVGALIMDAGCNHGGSNCGVAIVGGALLATGISLTGSVLGYELSNDQQRLTAPRTATRMHVSPAVVPTHGGLTLGASLTL